MDIDKIVSSLEKEIKEVKFEEQIRNVGKVTQIGDEVVRIKGLSEVAVSEMIELPNKIFGVVLNLAEDEVGAIVLGDYLKIKEGDPVLATGRLLSLPVGEELIGRVVDPLGRPLDKKGEIKTKDFRPVEKIAPGVTFRQPVNTPLRTGIKAIDAMIPIGRGQRELIIGDRGTGKTAIVLDTIINQKQTRHPPIGGADKGEKPVICIYVAIGQKTSRIAQVISILEDYGAMDHTIIVAASASDPASLQYLAPYSGCAMGEYFMDKGGDAVVFYDDLLKHAWAYRQISLVLRRPSGREAFPGDIFYLHSRLLERACRLSDRLGGGSLTALPIVETQGGDISAYIPTNIISITDGQIYLESDLFYAGVRPAINVGLSVSRVGGSAQVKAMKQAAGRLRLDMASYRELAAFAQFSAELDPKTRAQLDRGSRLTEILKQPQFSPVPEEEQVLAIWAGTNGYLDSLPVEKVSQFEKEYLSFFKKKYPKILKEIGVEKKLTEELTEKIKKTTEEFMSQYG